VDTYESLPLEVESTQAGVIVALLTSMDYRARTRDGLARVTRIDRVSVGGRRKIQGWKVHEGSVDGKIPV
jgi:hypothetical protein